MLSRSWLTPKPSSSLRKVAKLGMNGFAFLLNWVERLLGSENSWVFFEVILMVISSFSKLCRHSIYSQFKVGTIAPRIICDFPLLITLCCEFWSLKRMNPKPLGFWSTLSTMILTSSISPKTWKYS